MPLVTTSSCSVDGCTRAATHIVAARHAQRVPSKACSEHAEAVIAEFAKADADWLVGADAYRAAHQRGNISAAYSPDEAEQVWDEFSAWCLCGRIYPSLRTYAEWRASLSNGPPTSATLCKALGVYWMGLSQPLWNEIRERDHLG